LLKHKNEVAEDIVEAVFELWLKRKAHLQMVSLN